MSFLDCIKSTAALTPAQRQQIEKDYEKHYKTYQQTIGDNEAAHLAATRVVQSTIIELNAKNKAAINDILTYRQIKAKHGKIADTYELERNEAGKIGEATYIYGKNTYAAHQILEEGYTAQLAKQREYTMMAGEVIEKFRSKALGFAQDWKGFKNIVAEILQKDSGDAYAKATAPKVSELFEYMGNDFRGVGGVMGKLPNYFPQRLIASRVAPPKLDDNIAFEQWYNDMMPTLAWDKMIDDRTGMPFLVHARNQLPIDGEEYVKNVIMKGSFENIKSQGLNDILGAIEDEKVITGGRGGMMMRRSSSRFFVYKDADSFFKINDKYGVGDEGLFDTFMAHIESMARDVGTMKVLGAKPRNQYQRIRLLAAQDGEKKTMIDAMWKNLSGEILGVGNERVAGRYYLWRGINNLARAVFLTKAPLSTLSDQASMRQMAKLNGLPQYALAKSYLKILNPADATDRRFARRAILISQAASGNSIRQAKYAASMEVRNTDTRWGKFDNAMGGFSDMQHRLTGMSVITDATRQSSYMAIGGLFDEYRTLKLPYKELPDLLKKSMDKFGLGENEYNAIMRGKPTMMEEDLGYLLPEGMDKADKKIAFKYEMWLAELSQQSSNESRLFTQAVMNGGQEFGTGGRAMLGSTLMFKSFMVTQTINHIAPIIRRASATGKIGELSSYFVALTLMGALTLELKSLTGGFTAEDPTDGAFWVRAALQGGAIGLFGDLIQNDVSLYGKDFGDLLSGAPVGIATDIGAIVALSAKAAVGQKNASKNLRTKLAQVTTRYAAPTNVWYADLILNRVIMDSIERAIDPNFDRRMRNLEKRKLEERGAEPWWGAR
jgi:hypothetical protein